MSFIRALFSGVSGIKGHQTMMDVIGNNIANINTIGFKTGRATFAETFTQTLSSATPPPAIATGGGRLARGGTNPIQVGLGTAIGSIDNLFAQGTIQATGQATDIAVEGDGLFAVRINDSILYTRAGNFTVDGDGRLINPSTGGILQGRIANQFGEFPTGEAIVSGAALTDLAINRAQKIAARQTSEITLFGNLDPGAPFDIGDGTPTIVTVTTPMYDSLGNRLNLTMQFIKDTEFGAGDNQTWLVNLKSVQMEVNDALNTNLTEPGYITVEIDEEIAQLTFNQDGSLNADGVDDTGEVLYEFDNTQFGGVDIQPVIFKFGTVNPDFDSTVPSTWGPLDGVTGNTAQTSIAVRKQDGYASGLLEDFFIDQNGKITGKFSNGSTLTLSQVLLAQFDNVAGLEKIGDNLFGETGNSGSPIYSIAGVQNSSRIRGGTLEQSNVDLTEEFTNLILAQRGFQSNAKVVTTSDELIQDLISMKR
jgi:flagellar hook protein FlgE